MKDNIKIYKERVFMMNYSNMMYLQTKVDI